MKRFIGWVVLFARLHASLRAVAAAISPVGRRPIQGGAGENGKFPEHPRFSRLSPREREVYRLIESGLNLERIADSLGISVKTVKLHLRHARIKLYREPALESKTLSSVVAG